MLKRKLPDGLQTVKTVALYTAGSSIEDAEITDHPAVLLIRGNKLYMEGDYKEAYRVYKKAYSKDNSLIEAKINMGFALVRLGKLDKARKIFEGLPEGQKNEYIFNELGNIYARKENPEKAEDYYKRAMERNPEFALPYLNLSVLYISRREYDKAQEIMEKLNVEKIGEDMNYLKTKALYEYRTGKLENALENIKSYLERNPEDYVAWLLRAELEGLLGLTNEAENSAMTSFKIKPTVEAEIALMGFALDRGDLDSTIRIGKKLIKKGVKDFKVYKNMARAHFLMGKYPKAYEYATKALEIRESDYVRFLRAEAARKMGRYEDALLDVEAVARRNPDNPNVKILKALIVSKLGRSDEAINILDTVEVKNHLLYSAYAEVYLDAGDKERAIQWLERSIEERMNLYALRTLCKTLYEIEDFERMNSWIDKLIEMGGEDAFVWFLKGETIFKTDMLASEEYYEKAIGLDEKFKDAYIRLIEINAFKDYEEGLKKYVEKLLKVDKSVETWIKILKILEEYEYPDVVMEFMDRVVNATGYDSLRIHQIKALIYKGLYDDAERVVEELVKKVPENKEVLLYKGVVKYHKKEFEYSLEILESLENIYELEANYYKARVYFDSGLVLQSMAIVEKYEYSPMFELLKMELLFNSGKYGELMEYIDSVINTLRGKEEMEALMWRMRVLFSQGERDGAYKIGKDILKSMPRYRKVLILMAEETLRDGKYEEAEDYVKRALRISEDEDALFLHARILAAKGEMENALSILDRLDLESNANLLLFKADVLYKIGKLKDAASSYEEVWKIDRDNIDVLEKIGKIYYELKEYDKAIRYLEYLFSKDPSNPKALYYLPLSYYALERYEDAERMFIRGYERGLDELINNETYIRAYADTLLHLGKYDMTVKIIIEYGKESDQLRLIAGKAMYHMRKYHEAENYLSTIEDEKLRGEKIYYLAMIFSAMGRYEELDALLSSSGIEKGDILYYHGLSLLNLGKYKEALSKFEKYKEGGGEHRDLPYYMGLCLYHLERYEDAGGYFKEAEKINENAYQYEAISYYKIGDYENAVRLFKICEKKELMDKEMWFYYGDALENIGKDGTKKYEKSWALGYRSPVLAYKLILSYRDEPEKAVEYVDVAMEYGDEAKVLASEIYLALGRQEEAYEVIKDVGGLDATRMKAKILMELGRYEEAERILKEYAQEPEIAYELVKILVNLKRYDEALNYVEVGEGHAPLTYEKMMIYLNLKMWEELESVARELLNSGDYVKEANQAMALSLFHQKKYGEAIEYLEKCEDLGCNMDYYLGMAYYEMEDYKRAIKYLKNVEEGKYYLGMSMFRIGDYAGALPIFESLEGKEARVMAGLCAYHIGDYEKAIDYLGGSEEHKEELVESYFMVGLYEKVVELQPTNPRIIGLSHYYLGNVEKALEYMEKVPDKGPEDIYYMSLMYIHMENYEMAEEYLTRAKDMGFEGDTSEFEGVISFKRGEYDKAARLLKNTKNMEYRRMLGISLFNLGKYKDAVTILSKYDDPESRRYLALSLKNIGLRDSLAKAMVIFEELGDIKNAARCALDMGLYNKVVEYLRGQDDEDSLEMLFEAYYNMEREEKAVEIYERMDSQGKAKYAKEVCKILVDSERYNLAKDIIRQYFTEDFEWLLIKAKIAIAEKDTTTAIDALKRCKKLNPNDPEVSRLLAPILINMGDVKSALEEAKSAVESFPNDAISWYNLGLAYHKLGKEDMAIEALKKSVELGGGFKELWHLLGIIYLNNGEYDKAYESLRKIEKWDEDWNIAFFLGVSGYELEKYDEALKYINRAIEIRMDPAALLYKALILVELDRKEEAIKILREVVNMKPDFVEARKLLGSLLGGDVV